MMTRRRFFQTASSLVAAAQANAQGPSDYRALVCVFLFGGMDGNNMVVPVDAGSYATYAKGRPGIGLPADKLLKIQAQGKAYGLHPRLTELHKLYGEKRMAVVANTGMLVRPVTRAEIHEDRSGAVPRNLYSHSDQVIQWQTSNPLGTGTGWSGRAIDAVVGNQPASITPGVSFAGNSAQLVGRINQPTALTGSGAFGRSTMNSVEPQPTCSSARKSTNAALPFSRHGVIRASSASPLRNLVPEPNSR